MEKDKSIPKAAEGNVILLAPDGGTSICFAEVEYGVVDGFIEVPAAAAPILTESHGYISAE